MKLRSAALTLSLAALASTVLAQANSFQMINESGRTIGDPTDVTSTLDGKPVALKRYALGWNKAKGALYATPTAPSCKPTSAPSTSATSALSSSWTPPPRHSPLTLRPTPFRL